MQRQRFFGRPKESINSSTATVDQRSLFLFLEPWELIFCLVILLMSLDKRLGQDQKLPSERVCLSSTVLSILVYYEQDEFLLLFSDIRHVSWRQCALILVNGYLIGFEIKHSGTMFENHRKVTFNIESEAS